MKKYGVNELRQMFLDFMESKGHLVMKSFSLKMLEKQHVMVHSLRCLVISLLEITSKQKQSTGPGNF